MCEIPTAVTTLMMLVTLVPCVVLFAVLLDRVMLTLGGDPYSRGAKLRRTCWTCLCLLAAFSVWALANAILRAVLCGG